MPRPTPRVLIVLALQRSSRPLPSSAIAGEVGIEPPMAAAHLRDLRGQGLVVRLPNSNPKAGADWALSEVMN